MRLCLALFVLASVALSCTQAQVTFTRGWAPMGKRQVTFSRAWAPMGKRQVTFSRGWTPNAMGKRAVDGAVVSGDPSSQKDVVPGETAADNCGDVHLSTLLYLIDHLNNLPSAPNSDLYAHPAADTTNTHN